LQLIKYMPNKYPRIAQAELDLHQFTRVEAEIAVKDFLQDSERANYNLVRIIVGKGLHSPDGAVLGDFVRNWLRDNDYDFRDAKINEGGVGAIDIKL